MAKAAKESSESQPLNLERDVNRAVELMDKLQRTEYNAWLSKSINVDKIRELQNVFKSDLFNAVMKVYERVYDTVDINGSPDMKARATAKATVAIFAASEGHAPPRVVHLPKTEEGLGFNIMGGKEQSCPIYVSKVIPGGVADRGGQLQRGDQLMSVNGVSVEGESHEKAVQLLKAAQDRVTLVVRYTPRILDEMESRYDKNPRMMRRPM